MPTTSARRGEASLDRAESVGVEVAHVSFEKFVDNQERLRAEGCEVLQGLMRCAHCGRRMYVNFGGTKAARTPRYRCSRPRLIEAQECQLLGGNRLEAAVVEAFFEATKAAGAEAAALAGNEFA